MIWLKLLLNGGLIFIVSMAVPFNENIPLSVSDIIHYRLSDDVIPMHYDIWLRPFIHAYGYIAEGGRNEKIIDLIQKDESIIRKAIKLDEDIDYQIYFYGQSNVSINIYRATRRIVLHSLNLYIDENMTTLLRKDGVVGLYKPSNHLYGHDILILNFTDEVPSGYYSLQMKFVGAVSDKVEGLFKKSFYFLYEPKWIMTTYFTPIGARRVFPCWDEPTFKATFKIHFKHSTVYSALSNMPKIDEEEKISENKTIWTNYHTTPKISTYLVAVMLAETKPFYEKQLNQVTQKWRIGMHRLQIHPLLIPEVSVKVMTFLRNKWINYLNITKLEHIIIPNFQTSSTFTDNDMDGWGVIFYRETDIFYDNLQHIWQQMEVTRLIAFKMTRQVFVNLVSPSWWSHMWLNEALAQFFGMDAHNGTYPEQHIMDLFVVQDQQESFRLDNEPIMVPLAVEVRYSFEIENLFSSYPYAFTLRYKAPVIIRMLQHIVTNEIFEMGVRRYLDKHSATPDDLWKIIQIILNESDQHRHKQYNLKEVMDTWINLIHYPVVNVTLNFRGNIVIRIDYPNSVSSLDMWWTPLTYTTQKNLTFNDTSPKHWLSSTSPLYFPNETGWIIMNLQQSGYYRVNYFSENWWKIADFLNSRQYVKIHVLNRAQIIDDAYHFLVIGNLEFPIFLKLTKYLSRETDYLAWYPMFKILEHISNAFPLSVVHKPIAIFKVHMRNILGRLFRNIGYEEDSNENNLTKCLRQEATKWAYILGDSGYIKNAAIILKGKLKILEHKTILSKCKVWANYKNSLEKNVGSDMIAEYIKFMIPKRIAIVKQGESVFLAIKRKEVYINVLHIIAKYARNNKVLEYLLDNIPVILPSKLRIRGQIVILISIIDHLYSRKQLSMMSHKLVELFPRQKQLVSILENRIMTRIVKFTNDFTNYIYLQYSKE